ncbi:tetratricopeptide repeat protein [Anatilimnocola sp. NA78]|uniref:tetratricopeptide repeat protein n=1 Tax=Anatilimnocola sp. NA78 TaxID=3415683 RepID=UPI003CE455A5
MSWWKDLANKARSVLGAGNANQDDSGCQHGDAVHLRQGTAEFEYFVARGELESARNLPHGANHLANLLSYDPGRPEWVELLERYLVAAGPTPEQLIPRGEQLYYSTEALRAYIWHKQGRLHDAVELLLGSTDAKPDAQYLEAWALPWLETAGAVEGLPAPMALQLFAAVLGRYSERQDLTVKKARLLHRWSVLSERHFATAPTDQMNTMLRAGILRKAGRYVEAAKVAQAAFDQSPNWHAAVALGLIYRQQGDHEQAERAFRDALRLDPSDVSARLEAGDMYYRLGQWQRAHDWYEQALEVDRQHPWALPSSLMCSWKLTGDDQWLDRVIALAKGGNGRAGSLYNQEFFAGLPPPADATANILRKFCDSLEQNPQDPPVGTVKVRISGIEAPSVYLAFRMEMARLQNDLAIEVEVKHITQPDPRWPVEEVQYLLWDYEGTQPRPGLPPPDAELSAKIAKLAEAPFAELTNWASASLLAAELGPHRAQDLLAAIVHPPATPANQSTLVWLPRVQHTAMQVIAHLDDGWEKSIRRPALYSALFGPLDWTTEAAIRVLARLGAEYEPIAPDIHEAFQRLAKHRPADGYCCWERTLYSHWQELPHLFPSEREHINQYLERLDQAEEK